MNKNNEPSLQCFPPRVRVCGKAENGNLPCRLLYQHTGLCEERPAPQLNVPYAELELRVLAATNKKETL